MQCPHSIDDCEQWDWLEQLLEQIRLVKDTGDSKALEELAQAQKRAERELEELAQTLEREEWKMKPSENMEQIIGKVRYRVSDATLLAHDCYCDGRNMESDGLNTFLYKTPQGRYFAVHMTLWQGERDYIEPLTEEDAYELYERLPEKEIAVEKAFPDEVIEMA